MEGSVGLDLPNPPLRLSAGIFWQFAAVAAFMPMLPLYFSERGVTASGIAFLFSLHALVALGIGQVIGYVADLYLSRVKLLAVMTTGSAVVCALFPYLPQGILPLALGVLVLAIFFSHRVPVYMSLILDSRGGERHFGPIRLVGSVSFALFALLIGFLADLPGSSVAVMWPALVVFELLFLGALMGIRDIPPRQRHDRHQSELTFREAQRLLLSNKVFRYFLIFIFLCQFVAFPGYILQINLLKELGASSSVTTASLAIAAISEVVIFLFARRITGKIRLMPLFALVPFSLFLRFLLVAVATSPALILASNALHMINFGLLYLCAVLLVNREAPPSLRSSGQTLFTLVFANLSVLTGNLAASGFLRLLTGGTIAEMGDLAALRWMFTVACVIPLLAYFFFFPMKREYERKHQVSGVFIRPSSDRLIPPAETP